MASVCSIEGCGHPLSGTLRTLLAEYTEEQHAAEVRERVANLTK